MEIKERLQYPDVLRAISTFAVVFAHIAGRNLWAFEAGSYLYNISVLYSGLTRFAVPMFFMLSGMFLLDPNKNITNKMLFKKQMLRIVTAYTFWTVFYAVFKTFTAWDFSRESCLERITDAIFVNRHYHLWFLPVIFGLYVITPYLRKIVAGCTKREMEVFLLLAFIVVSLKPLCQKLEICTPLTGLINEMQINMVTGCVGWYMLGFYFKKYFTDMGKGIKVACCLTGLVAYILGTYLTLTEAAKTGTLASTWINTTSIMMVPQVIAVYIVFRVICEKHPLHEKQIKYIQILSADAFGIYLLHDAFIVLFEKIGFSTQKFNTMFSIPIITVLVFCTTWLVVHFARKIITVRKFMM